MALLSGLFVVYSSQASGSNPYCGGVLAGDVSTEGVTIAGQPITTEQASNARVIVQTANALGLSARDAKIGLMTSLQEAKLINNSGGDRDSAGIYQQRPSQGWGTYEQVTDPVYAANTFFERLVTIENRDQLPLMEVAILVQRPSRAAYTSPSNNFNGWEATADQLLGGADKLDFGSASVCASGLPISSDLGQFSDPGEGPQDLANGNLVPRAANLRELVFANWGCDVKSEPCVREIGGYSVRPAGTPQDHTLGLAIDITIGEAIGQYPNAEYTAFGWGIVCLLKDNSKRLGVRYIIWQGKIWNTTRNNEGGGGGCSGAGTGWREYCQKTVCGRSLGPVQGHYDHIHVTVQPGVGG